MCSVLSLRRGTVTLIGALATLVAMTLFCWAERAHAQEPTDTRPLLEEDFSDGIDGWRLQRLSRRSTLYQVVDMDGGRVLKASSNEAAAALLMAVDAGDVRDGRLSWRWRVMASLADNDRETESAGDDYAARVFVLFGSAEIGADTRAIAYAWAGRSPIGSRYPNPNASQVGTIVLQSGDEHAGEWIVEERDVFADYERSFGEPAPALAGIALLVDTDDTGTAAMAWFDEIELRAGVDP